MKKVVPRILLLLCLLECNILVKSDAYINLCSHNDSVVRVVSNEYLSNQCDIQNSTIACTSLQAAIVIISERKELNNFTICIEESSTQFLPNRMFFDKVSIQIVSKESVLVECIYDSNLENDVANDTDYTWYFNSSLVLLMVNVHLRFCPYPLRMVGVKKVLMQNSSFK